MEVPTSVPVVSVVIPAFNMARYLPSAVRSALDQSFRDLEVLIVDDGSSDNTREVAAALAVDCRVRYLRQANAGSSAARNLGIRSARGAFVALLDADDLWLPTKLERQLEAVAARPSAVGAYTASIDQVIDDRLEEVSRIVVRAGDPRPLAVRERLLGKNVIPGSSSSVVARTAELVAAGLFDEGLAYYQDQDMWRRLARRGELVYVGEPLVTVRIRRDGESADLRKVVRGHLQYLEKLVADTPVELRPKLPRAVFSLQCRLATILLRAGEWRACARQVGEAIRPGPRFALLFLVEMALFSYRRAREAVSGVRVLA